MQPNPGTLNGQYIGIVIQKYDPMKLGRVQVYIPALDHVLLDTITQGKSSFIFPGDTNEGSLSMTELKKLRQVCTWAYVAQPVVGGGSMGRLEETTGTVTVSNSAQNTKMASFKSSGYNHGTKSKGAMYNGTFNQLKDAFADPSRHSVRHCNTRGNDYCPPNFTDAPNGLYSRPEIGAQVLVSFLGGQKSNAVITGKVPFTREHLLIEDQYA